MTMKIMSSTSKISISGTTFISAIAPPLLSPTDIPIANLLSACVSRAFQAIKPRQVGAGAAYLIQQTNGANTAHTCCPTTTPNGLISRWSGTVGRRRRRPAFLLILLGQQPQLIDAGRADFVHHCHNVAVLGSSIALNVNSLIETGGQHVFNLSGDIFLSDLRVLKVDRSISSDRYDNRVILVSVLHFLGVVDPGHMHWQA